MNIEESRDKMLEAIAEHEQMCQAYFQSILQQTGLSEKVIQIWTGKVGILKPVPSTREILTGRRTGGNPVFLRGRTKSRECAGKHKNQAIVQTDCWRTDSCFPFFIW